MRKLMNSIQKCVNPHFSTGVLILSACCLMWGIRCLDKEIHPLFYSKCFSLSYHSQSPLPALLQPPRLPGLSSVQIFQGAGLSMVRCFCCLLGGLQLTIWLCGQPAVLSTDHPAGSCCHNDLQAGQETGNRKKKAGHPVLPYEWVEHDITKATWKISDHRPNVLSF